MSAVLDVKNLTVRLKSKKQSDILVENAAFAVEEGKCLGILGESGSGKSITCKAIMGLLDSSFAVSGQAMFGGRDLIGLGKEPMRKLRGNEICMILQNPMTCFDPLYRIGDQMAEGLHEHTNLPGKDIHKKCLETLGLMCIQNPEDFMRKYPHQLSGGMLQRVMIGLALVMRPKLIIADEPTTAIDSITQFEIIKEFQRIKSTNNAAMIFVSHDLGVVSKLADEVIVMHNSQIRQRGTMKEIVRNPTDSYTRFLVDKKLRVMEQFNRIMYTKTGEVA